jgi:phosphohistidine phosphatase
MKRLTLVRHAKSSWKDRTLDDSQRPLSRRGEQDAPKMGARLLARKARPSLIMSSPAARALATAKLIADTLGYPMEFLQVEPRLYLATPKEMLALIAGQEDSFSDLLLVGHNPGMTEVANRLVPELRLDNLPTAGVVAMDFQTRKWSELPATRGELAYYDYPKNPELLLIED